MDKQRKRANVRRGACATRTGGCGSGLISLYLLVACVAWLIVNSMRVERVQFNQLCVQNVTNVFRKVAFREIAAAEAAGSAST